MEWYRLADAPADPLHNLAASWHIYNFSWRNTITCWNGPAYSVARQVPLILGELDRTTAARASSTPS